MLFAENYLSLKMCEGWLRVSNELQKEGITPVETDNDLLMERVKQIRQWKTYIQYRIELIVKNEKQTVLIFIAKWMAITFDYFRNTSMNWKLTLL